MISIIEQATLDLDWFIVDKKGSIAIFSSGGGILPKYICENYDVASLKTVSKFFQDLNFINENVKINSELSRFVDFKTEDEYTSYIKFSTSYSQKGLYAFDHTVPCDMVETMYHLVASPVIPLNINDIPVEIMRKLTIQTFQGNFEGLKEFDIKELGIDVWGQ